MMQGVKAVIFDLDGTLIDSSKGFLAAHHAVSKRLFSHFKSQGIKINDTEIYSKLVKFDDMMNLKRLYDRDSWWSLFLVDLNVETEFSAKMEKELTSLYWDNFEDGAESYGDAESTLNYLIRKGYRLGMITDTDGEKGLKRNRLNRLHLKTFFEAVVISGEDTPHTKPDPSPFLLVAEKLTADPRECVMIGDKPFNDIRGGNVSGMRTILLKSKDWGTEERSDFTIWSLSELRQIL